MKFAENNRISHRQLYRQIILAFLAPFLLCLLGKNGILGISGVIGTAAALFLLLFYVIFLIRLAPSFADLYKTAGWFWARVIGAFFIVYILLTGAYLLHVLAEIVPDSLLTGVPGTWIAFFAVLVCSLGTDRGMQKRGRIAEVSGALLLGSVLVMMLLCLGQSRLSYFAEMTEAFHVDRDSILRSTYTVLCAFSGIGLIPFLLENVEKQGSAGKPAVFGILTLGAMILGMLLLLPAVFGWQRLIREPYPILPLLAGADLPGNVLARFDVLWMGFLLYSLLFSLGSLFHYGHQIIRQTRLGTGRVWMAAVIYFLSMANVNGLDIQDCYGVYLAYFFVPGLLLCQVLVMLLGRGRRKRKMTAAAVSALFLVFSLSGCAGVEPEKRMFPLALGIDASGQGFVMTYGMPDLPQATGQEKPEENGTDSVLSIEGNDFTEIEAVYNRSQEKYLDLGHLQALIMGQELIDGGRWEKALDYLEQDPFVGENVYVFRAQNVKEVLSFRGSSGTSVGEYLTGLLENRTSGQQERGTTLRQLYHEYFENGRLPLIPEVKVINDRLEIFLG